MQQSRWWESGPGRNVKGPTSVALCGFLASCYSCSLSVFLSVWGCLLLLRSLELPPLSIARGNLGLCGYLFVITLNVFFFFWIFTLFNALIVVLLFVRLSSLLFFCPVPCRSRNASLCGCVASLSWWFVCLGDYVFYCFVWLCKNVTSVSRWPVSTHSFLSNSTEIW